ncbi:MAG TPA: hypothetical protein VF412_02665 [Bdellovibrio sp.]|uniref:hypothetical protein n=1 Tax=Bdellovibrio sp. TaxID=28201 RepID=UPI002F14C046
MSSYVFLTECADLGEAQVVKSFLESQGFHPKVRDEQTRSVAPHLQNLLGELIIEVPEFEFMEASQALESLQPRLKIVRSESETEVEQQEAAEIHLQHTQSLAKKCLTNSILGCVFIPIFCTLYSMVLGWKVLAQERPLSKVSRNRLAMAIVFNTMGLYIWLVFGLRYFLHNM